MSSNQQIFILGVPRSGTSLLARMINAHPEIGVPQESHIYNHFFDIRPLYGDLAELRNQERLLLDIVTLGFVRNWSPSADVNDAISKIAGPGFGAVFDALMSSWAQRQGKSSWGEKTPSHIDYIDPILRDFPQAKLIHIVRDPRDVCLSMIRARFGPKNPFAAAKAWKRYVKKTEAIEERYATTGVVEIRYEDLLADPPAILKHVCSSVGVDYSESMLRYYDDANPYNTDVTNLINLQKPVITNNSGKWKRHLKKEAVKTIEAVTGHSMSKYGYNLSEGSACKISSGRRIALEMDNKVKRLFSMAKNGRGYGEAARRLQLRTGLFLRSMRGNQ